jgi:protein-disulfide isomerase
VVVYFKNFPLSSNPDSQPAAQAALAAHRQGKFDAMHTALFEHLDAHGKKALFGYAREQGLDMTRFAADFAGRAVVERVFLDRKEGIAAEVTGTPSLYLNGREYSDPLALPFVKDWIDEELAVNAASRLHVP